MSPQPAATEKRMELCGADRRLSENDVDFALAGPYTWLSQTDERLSGRRHSQSVRTKDLNMDESLRVAKKAIASEIGADVGYFTPEDEKHLFIVDDVAVIGGLLLIGFFHGLASKVGEKIGEKVGDEVGDRIAPPIAGWVGGAIDKLTGKDKESQDRQVEEARDQANRQIQASGKTPQEVAGYALVVEAEMKKELSETAPDDVSSRIMVRVRLEAMRTL